MITKAKSEDKFGVYSACWDFTNEGFVVQHRAHFKFFPKPKFESLLERIKKDCKTKAVRCEKVVKAKHVGRQFNYELQRLKKDTGCDMSSVTAAEGTKKDLQVLQKKENILQYAEPEVWLDGTKNHKTSLGYRQTSDTNFSQDEYVVTAEQVGSNILSTAFPDKR